MFLHGIRIDEIDGWHDDDWCRQLVRGRGTATSALSTFVAKIWFPKNAGEDTCIATLTVDHEEPSLFNLTPESPTELTMPVNIAEGETITFRLFCNNRIANLGEEKRQLSFVLMGLSCT
jgi:hypothetical protein